MSRRAPSRRSRRHGLDRDRPHLPAREARTRGGRRLRHRPCPRRAGGARRVRGLRAAGRSSSSARRSTRSGSPRRPCTIAPRPSRPWNVVLPSSSRSPLRAPSRMLRRSSTRGDAPAPSARSATSGTRPRARDAARRARRTADCTALGRERRADGRTALVPRPRGRRRQHPRAREPPDRPPARGRRRRHAAFR